MQPAKKPTRKEKIIAQSGEPRKIKSAAHLAGETKLYKQLGWLIALLAVILYINTLGHDFVYDDINVITRNHLVKEGVSSIPTLLTTSYRFGYFEGEDELYRPLSNIVFTISWQLFPDNPFPGHLLNIVLYAFTGYFLFRLLSKLLSSFNIIVPFIATVIYIAHPIHTEVVANIKSLDEIMSFLFVIFAMLFMIRHVDLKTARDRMYSMLCFFLALLSKESAIMMFAVIPLTIYFFRDVTAKRAVGLMMYFVVPLAVYLLMRVNALGAVTGTKHFPFIDNILVEAGGYFSRLPTVLFIIANYLRLMIYPHPLSSDYSFKQFELTGWDNPLVIISLIVHAGLFAFAISGLRKKSIYSYSILFYLLTIFLSSNLLFVIGSAFAERFLYVPLLGLAIVISVFISKIFQSEKISAKYTGLDSILKYNRKEILLLIVLLLPMAYKTMARNLDWKSDYILFENDSKSSPLSARSHYSFADNIVKEKILKSADEKEQKFWADSALAEYNRAIDIYPAYADAIGQRGFAYFIKGDKPKAYEDYRKAIELKSQLETTFNNMGYLYSESGEHETALGFYIKAVEINPRFVDAWRNIGSSYYAMKDFNQAITAFTQALKFAPQDPNINYFLGTSYQAIGDNASAQVYMEKANRLNSAQ